MAEKNTPSRRAKYTVYILTAACSFSSFGDLAEVMVMKDPATRRSRGFGFITFSDPTAVEKVMKYPVHQVNFEK